MKHEVGANTLHARSRALTDAQIAALLGAARGDVTRHSRRTLVSLRKRFMLDERGALTDVGCAFVKALKLEEKSASEAKTLVRVLAPHEGNEEERRAAKTVDLKLSPTQIAILRRAARRSTGHVCPTRLRGAAEEVCLDALEKRGMITRTDPTDGTLAPTITEAGRAAVRLPGEDL